jgi:hypothetical protein
VTKLIKIYIFIWKSTQNLNGEKKIKFLIFKTHTIEYEKK